MRQFPPRGRLRQTASSGRKSFSSKLGRRMGSVSHPPKRRRLLVAGAVGRIIGGLDLREPLHADCVDLSDPVFEPSALHLIFDLAIPQGTFERDELSFLESPGKLREIAPGIDAMPFRAGFVLAFVVLPAF